MSHDDPGRRDLGGLNNEDLGNGGLGNGEPGGPGQDGPGGVAPGLDVRPPPPRDKRIYAALMGTCVGLIIIAWEVVRHFSVLAAIIMSAAALLIPPVAVIIANRASAVDRR
jgi:hypothetical protein